MSTNESVQAALSEHAPEARKFNIDSAFWCYVGFAPDFVKTAAFESAELADQYIQLKAARDHLFQQLESRDREWLEAIMPGNWDSVVGQSCRTPQMYARFKKAQMDLGREDIECHERTTRTYRKKIRILNQKLSGQQMAAAALRAAVHDVVDRLLNDPGWEEAYVKLTKLVGVEFADTASKLPAEEKAT